MAPLPLHRTLSVTSIVLYLGVAVVALLLTRKRASFGLAAMIVIDPFDYSSHFLLTTVSLPKVVLFGVAVGLLTGGSSLRPLGLQPVRGLLVACAALAVVTALTAIPGVYIDAVARETLKAFEYLATFCVAAVAYARDPDERIVWTAMTTAVAVVCLLALPQFVTGTTSSAYIGSHTISRIAGPLEGPNQLAGYLDVGFSMLLAYVAVRRRAIAAVVLAIAALTDVLTLSRAGAIGVTFGTVAVLGRVAGKMRRTIVVGFGLAVALATMLLAYLGALGRLFSIQETDYSTGLGTRAQLWSAALRFFVTHPVLGIGAGNFELQLPTLGVIGVRTHANSLYLQALAEGGILLFAAVVLTIALGIRLLYVAPETGAFAIGAGAATIALAVHQTLDDMTFFPKVGGFWWLCLGIAAASLAVGKSKRTA